MSESKFSSPSERELEYLYHGIMQLETINKLCIKPKPGYWCWPTKISVAVCDHEGREVYRANTSSDAACCYCFGCSDRFGNSTVSYSVTNLSNGHAFYISSDRTLSWLPFSQTGVKASVALHPRINIGGFKGRVGENFVLTSTSGHKLCYIKSIARNCCQPCEYEVTRLRNSYETGRIRYEDGELSLLFPNELDVNAEALLLSCAICMHYELEKAKVCCVELLRKCCCFILRQVEEVEANTRREQLEAEAQRLLDSDV